MKKFRILALCLATCVLLGSLGVCASEYNVIKVDTQEEGGYTVFSVDVQYPETFDANNTVYVVPEANLTAAKGGDMSSAVYYSGGSGVGADKKATYEFLMRAGAADGVYAIVTGEGTTPAENRTRYFMYKAAGSASELGSLNTASNFASALTTGAASDWYIDLTDPAYTANQTDVISIMQGLKGSGFQSTFAVEDAFILACDFANITATPVEKLLADVDYNAAILGVDTANTDYTENKLLTVQKLKNLGTASNITTKADIVSNFEKACALSCLSTSDRTTSIADLQKYTPSVFTNISFAGDYLKVDPFDLAKAFENKDFNTVAEVENTFNTTIAALVAQNNAVQGGLGGSGGGGGGGTASSSTIGSAGGEGLVTDIQNQNEVTAFSDVKGSHWAAEYIKFVYENEIMTGDGNGKFRPDAAISREEWVKVILEAFNIEKADGEMPFTDVKEGQWYTDYVETAYILDIANGVSDTLFGIGMSISRQDAVTMIHRLAGNLRELPVFEEAELKFTDSDKIADYAQEAVLTFSEMGIINGYQDGSFNPDGNITRAEAAKIIYELINAVG